MPFSRIARLAMLTSFVTVAGTIGYLRGFGWNVGAVSSASDGRYTTEESWIVGEIVRDLTEMSAYPAKVGSDPVIASGGADGVFQVSLSGVPDAVVLDLSGDVWNVDAFAGIARAALRERSPEAEGVAARVPGVLASLTNPTPATLVAMASETSRALGINMRNARAHEAAALILGGFALRESAGGSSDTRWAMNRMTAHLAMARAAEGQDRTIDGDMAHAILLTLSQHQTRAIEALDRLTRADRSPEVAAWTRALRLRLTDDWRIVPDPESATRLEKREYFRARRATVPSIDATIELTSIGEDLGTDWMRILWAEGAERAGGAGRAGGAVREDSWILADVLQFERDEYQRVYRMIRGRDVGWLSGAINDPATRLVGSRGPDVLPWGAWAEFAQRHMSMLVGRSVAYYRHAGGSVRAAEREKRRLRDELGTLWMFPSATVWWTEDAESGEADLALVDEAISGARKAPQRMPAAAWSLIETATKSREVRRVLPPANTWFLRPSPRALYEARSRIRHSGHPPTLADIIAMRKEAPYDYALASAYLAAAFGEDVTAEQMLGAFDARSTYDLRVIRTVIGLLEDRRERLKLLRRGCELSGFECLALGNELADGQRDEEATVAFERAFDDRSVATATVANSASWLVDHYFHAQQFEKAVALAERIASTGEAAGMATAAYLYERLDRSSAAEIIYTRIAREYNDPSQLLGFYYRAAMVRRRPEYEKKWRQQASEVFHDGLLPVADGETRPERGVIVVKDSDESKRAGLQAGDIIVGLEGFRVDDERQFHAINAFVERDEMRLTAWRGQSRQVVTAPRILTGVHFRTYPAASTND